jgi:hypothetical protein
MGQEAKVAWPDQALNSQKSIPPAAPAAATNKSSLTSTELMRSGFAGAGAVLIHPPPELREI